MARLVNLGRCLTTQLFSYPDVFSLTLDPAAGQTTSQQSPPFTLPRTLGQPPTSTSALQNVPSEHRQMLDRSQSAPAAVRQASASGPCRDPPGDQELPQPSASAKNVVTTPHPVRPPSPPLAPAVSPSEVLGASFPAEATTRAQDPGGAGEGGAGPEESMSTALLPQPEECSPTQAMEQEEVEPQLAEDAGADLPTQSDPVEMEFPVDSQDTGSSEGEQPERERPSCSGSIPSLAAALMELHELLESNSQAHATSCSSSQPVQQEPGPAGPDSHTPALDVIHIPGPAAAAAPGAESSDAKANTFAAVSDEGPSNCVAPGPPQPEGGGAAQNVGQQRPPQCPEGSVEETTTQEREEVEKTCVLQADPDAPPVPVGEPELREPVTGCQESPGLQGQHASLGPSAAAGEVSDPSIGSPPPLPEAPQLSPADPAASTQHPFTDHFPAEHIQRIQAAGFSASEAAEALQRAHGVVELALLALLARSITVPT